MVKVLGKGFEYSDLVDFFVGMILAKGPKV